MTLEELQAQVKELTDSLKAQEEANKGLRADLTKAKNDLRKGQEIDPAEFAALQTENQSLKDKVTALDKDFKKVTGERDTLAKTLETESKITLEMQRDSDLTNGLASINVTHPVNLKAAKAMLAAQVTVVTEGDKRITKVGDKLLADHLKEWATSEEGKHFVSAPNNNGGGANGGGGNPTGKTIKQSDFDALGSKERATRMAEGYTVVD